MSKKKGRKVYQIGLNVGLARKDKKMLQKELADLMGVDRTRISDIESGKNCEIKAYDDAAAEMGMSLEELAIYHITHKKDDKK
jgi:transcriptional regulator with XRE-family HTH domain